MVGHWQIFRRPSSYQTSVSRS